eukprot:Pgem_evm1s20042
MPMEQFLLSSETEILSEQDVMWAVDLNDEFSSIFKSATDGINAGIHPIRIVQ